MTTATATPPVLPRGPVHPFTVRPSGWIIRPGRMPVRECMCGRGEDDQRHESGDDR